MVAAATSADSATDADAITAAAAAAVAIDAGVPDFCNHGRHSNPGSFRGGASTAAPSSWLLAPSGCCLLLSLAVSAAAAITSNLNAAAADAVFVQDSGHVQN